MDPFPRSRVWCRCSPKYYQPDVVMTAVPFRFYMILLVCTLLPKPVRVKLPYWEEGWIHTLSPALLQKGAVLAAAI